MIIRSIGESWWTDKTTGKEISHVGPLYMHFNLNCLEQFDNANFYGPTERFDVSRLTVNENNHK